VENFASIILKKYKFPVLKCFDVTFQNAPVRELLHFDTFWHEISGILDGRRRKKQKNLQKNRLIFIFVLHICKNFVKIK